MRSNPKYYTDSYINDHEKKCYQKLSYDLWHHATLAAYLKAINRHATKLPITIVQFDDRKFSVNSKSFEQLINLLSKLPVQIKRALSDQLDFELKFLDDDNVVKLVVTCALGYYLQALFALASKDEIEQNFKILLDLRSEINDLPVALVSDDDSSDSGFDWLNDTNENSTQGILGTIPMNSDLFNTNLDSSTNDNNELDDHDEAADSDDDLDGDDELDTSDESIDNDNDDSLDNDDDESIDNDDTLDDSDEDSNSSNQTPVRNADLNHANSAPGQVAVAVGQSAVTNQTVPGDAQTTAQTTNTNQALPNKATGQVAAPAGQTANQGQTMAQPAKPSVSTSQPVPGNAQAQTAQTAQTAPEQATKQTDPAAPTAPGNAQAAPTSQAAVQPAPDNTATSAPDTDDFDDEFSNLYDDDDHLQAAQPKSNMNNNMAVLQSVQNNSDGDSIDDSPVNFDETVDRIQNTLARAFPKEPAKQTPTDQLSSFYQQQDRILANKLQ